MKRKTIIILVCCFLSATILVVTLYAISDKIVHEPGSFLRVYQKAAAVKSNEMDIKYNSYYIAGIAEDRIYLGNITTPRRLLVTNLSLTDSQHVKINLRGMENKRIYKSDKIKISPPYFYYMDGITPGLLRGKIGEWQADPFMFDSAYFDQSEIIGSSTFAIRTHNMALENVLGKVQNTDPHIALEPSLLQKQIDGIFCTDGMLRYNETLNRLIYTYYYRNEYIVYDTNLNLDYRGHTIDTFSRAQIKTAYVSSNKTHAVTSRKFTNYESCTSGNYLFINSNLLAKNDFKRMLDIMAIIDVYDLRNNTYKFSFSLPNYDAETQLREFRIYNDKILIALYDHYIVKYDLQSRYFKDNL
jgi:hypothetical protein